MDRIQQILAILADVDQVTAMTDGAVGDLEAELLGIFASIRAGEYEGVESTDVATLTAVRDAVQSLQALAGQRIEAAEETAREIAELEASLAAVENPEDPEDPEDPEPEIAPVEEAAEPELVTASVPARPSLAAVAGRQPARARRPAPQAAPTIDPRVTIRSTDGGVLDSMTAAAEAMSKGFKNVGTNRGKVTLVEIRGDYPEERQLSDIDYRANAAKMDAITAAGARPDDSLVAAGGWDAPAEVRYDLVVQATANRPVWNSLTHFEAARGSVTLPTSPTMSDIDVTYDVVAPGGAEAVSIWTTANDVGALSDEFTKPVQRVTNPEYNTFTAYAVVRRFRNGNMAAKANPENVAAWNTLLMAQWARVGDSKLLEAMKQDAGTTNLVDPTPVFGAARDIAEQLLRLTAFMRSAERADENASIHAWLPRWLLDLMQADLIRTNRADATEALIVAEASLESQLRDAGVNATWYVDSPLTGPTQLLRKQADGGLSAQWPCAVQYGLAFEGHYAAMDMAGLDLGVVRSPDLNEVNDFESFAESYEGLIAHRGPEALWVTQTLTADGSYAAATDGVIPDCS